MNRIGNLAYNDEEYEYRFARQDMERKKARVYSGSNNPDGYERKRMSVVSDASEGVLRKSNSRVGVKNKALKKADSGKKAASAKMSKISLELIAAIVILAASAGVMISSYVRVNEGRSDITALEENLKNEEAKTSQKSFELEQSIDLTEIEKEATTRLEMQRPEKYQKIYINVPTEDVTHTTSDSVEGIGNRIKSLFGKIGSAIIEFFSIK